MNKLNNPRTQLVNPTLIFTIVGFSVVLFSELETDSLGIFETSFSGLRTLKDRSIRRSTSTLVSANTVIDLIQGSL